MFTPLPNDQVLDMTKLKGFADDKLNVDKTTISLLDRVENTEGKGENAGYQHFLLFPSVFSKVIFSWVVKPFPKQGLVFLCLLIQVF